MALRKPINLSLRLLLLILFAGSWSGRPARSVEGYRAGTQEASKGRDAYCAG